MTRHSREAGCVIMNRHSREGGNPGFKHDFKGWFTTWIPDQVRDDGRSGRYDTVCFAGMTLSLV